MAINSTPQLPYTTTPLTLQIPHSHSQPQILQQQQQQKQQWRHYKSSTILSLSFSPRRRRRRPPTRRNPNRKDSSQSPSTNSGKLQFVLDVEQLKHKAPFLQRTLTYCENKLDEFIISGTEAYKDLQSLVRVEPGSNRVVVSCSESTVRFVGGVLIWSCVAFVLVRVLVNLGLGFRGRNLGGRVEVVTRRDRSLGGREVVVERRVVERGERGSDVENVGRVSKAVVAGSSVRRGERKLPEWWPVISPRPVVEVLREEYQRQANRIIQAIMDDKLSGKDVSEDRILDLRRICRNSGIRLSFGTENARDSLYRSSVHNIISTCCKAGSPSVQIDGEDARLFVAGLAYDFGVTALRAATIVSAAVAARTRLWFLQAWALEMQAKHSEAVEELKKICLVHQIFPPEPSSPEMEMVARGLQKNLNLEQRELLLNKLIAVCGEESRRSAGEALGLV